MNTDLQQFLIERIVAYDPTADTSPGSPVFRHVVDPVLARLGPDPISTPIRAFVLDRVISELGLTPGGPGDPLTDLVVNILETVLTPIRRELVAVRAAQSLADPTQLTDSEADALIANLLGSREQGDTAGGTVRIYFANARKVEIDASVYAVSTTGLRYYAVDVVSYSSTEVSENVEDGQYWVDFEVEAEYPGADYDLARDSIAAVFGVSGVVRATNRDAISGGVPRETTGDLIERIRDNVGERSLNTEGGIVTRLVETFPALLHVKPIGYGDVEMIRDIIEGTVTVPEGALGLGPTLLNGVDGEGAPYSSGLLGAGVLYENTTPKTILFGSATADFTTLDPTDVLIISGVEHGVDQVLAPGQVHLDDIEVVASGGNGATFQFAPFVGGIAGARLQYAEFLFDATVNFVTLGVQVGDWLRVRGDWIPPAVPTVPDLASGPGNAVSDYYEIIQVSANRLYVATLLGPEVTKCGGVSTLTGCNVDVPTQRLALTAPTPNFLDGMAVQPGDFVTIEGTVPPTFSPEEHEVASVDAANLLTLVTAPTTDTAFAFSANWSVRRGPNNGGVAQSALILGNASLIEWAVLHFATGLDPNATTGWVSPTGVNLPFTAHAQLTLSDVQAQVGITVGGVPAAVTFPNTPEGTIDVSAGDEVHIGGATDAYVNDATPDPLTQDFVGIRDESPLAEDTDLITDPVELDVVSSAVIGTITATGAVLTILEGAEAGTYRILTQSGSSVRLDTTLSGALTGVRFQVTSLIKIALDAPKVHKVRAGTALQTVLLSDIVLDATADFTDAGVEVGDTLEILSGTDTSTYTVSAVVSPTQLQLSAVMHAGASGLGYSIYTALAAVARPFRRFTKLELLGGDGSPSGIEIPHADPVDARISTTTSAGTGIKTTDIALNIVGTGKCYVETGVDLVADFGVGAGDTLVVTSGPSAGTYTIYNVLGNAIWITSGPPLRESFPAIQLNVPYDTLVGGPFQVGDTLTDGGAITYGTVIDVSTPGWLRVSWTYYTDPANNDPLAGSLSGATALVNGQAESDPFTYEIGSPATGTVRVHLLEPTYLEAVAASIASGDATTFTSESGVRYLADHTARRTVHEVVEADADGEFCPNLSVLVVTVTAGGPFVPGENVLEINIAGALIGTVIDVVGTTVRLNVTGTPPVATDTIYGAGSVTTALVDAGGATTTPSALVSPMTDFWLQDIRTDDLVELLTVSLTGSADLSAGANLSGIQFTVLVDGLPQTVTFSGTNPIALDQAGVPGGLTQQINAQTTGLTARVFTDSIGQDRLELRSASRLEIGTKVVANAAFGFVSSTDNDPAGLTAFSVGVVSARDTVTLVDVGPTGGPDTPSTVTANSQATFRIRRAGRQAFSPLDMAASVSDGLWFVDVEVRSEYPGDTMELAEGTRMVVARHLSYGYRLRSRNDALTYSSIEQSDLEITPLLADPLLVYDPATLVKIVNSDVRVHYEYGGSVMAAQQLMIRDSDRVVCNNPLVRFMLPSFVRLTVTWTGGSQAAVLGQDLYALIDGTPPTVELEVADVYALFDRRGASKVTGPIELLAVKHGVDRAVTLVRSKDRLVVGRTAKLHADRDAITLERT